MLDKVHLLVIKRFNDKFLSFALAVPSDGSLRGPSLQEILSADRAVWQAVHALIRDHSGFLSDRISLLPCSPVPVLCMSLTRVLRLRPHLLRPTPAASAQSPAAVQPPAARRPRLNLPPRPPGLTRCLLQRRSTNLGTRRSMGSRRA